MKYVVAACYLLGAFTWPWCAGAMWVLEDYAVVVVLLAWSFIAWWKIVSFARRKLRWS